MDDMQRPGVSQPLRPSQRVWFSQRVWVAAGALAGFGAVAMAAVGAHALGGLPPPAVAGIHSATEMLGWHALALLAVGLWAPTGGRLANAAGAAFVLGLLLFCGALYLHGFGGINLGSVAPVGGTLLMLGWLLLGASALRAR